MVLLSKPKTLNEAYSTAYYQEQTLDLLYKKTIKSYGKPGVTPNPFQQKPVNPHKPINPHSSSSNSWQKPFQHSKGIELKRDNSKCFQFGYRWGPGHVCQGAKG